MADIDRKGALGSVVLRAREAVTVLLALTVLSWLAGPASAEAYTGINEYELEPSTTQAGAHPDIRLLLSFDNRIVDHGESKQGQGEFDPNDPCYCQDVVQIDNHMPTGFIGNPHATPRCSLSQFSENRCPSEAQVGVLLLAPENSPQFPIYNMVPHPNEPGLLAFKLPFVESPGFIQLHARTGSDYGLDATTPEIYHLAPINYVGFILWGVPADSSHDPVRQPSPQNLCNTTYPEPCPGAVRSNATPAPFLENPTSCGVPLTGGLELTYYDSTVVHDDAPWPATTGCDQLEFNPSLAAKPTTTEADTATGIDVDLKVPQTQSPTVPSPSEIRSTTVTLPKGFSINPNAADGKVSCADVEGAFGTEKAADCPEYSKIGTDQIDSTALPGPIDGAIYLGEPRPGDRYRIFVTADGFSTHVKLAGSAFLDPDSGQIVVKFDNLPQSPLQEFSMHLFGSERGLLATPTRCGRYPVETEFVPWDHVLPNEHSTSFVTIDSGPNGGPCPGQSRPFAPRMTGGAEDNTAGRHSPFSLEWNRPDGDQNLTSLTVKVPPGLTATLAGIPYCPDSALEGLDDSSYSGRSEEASPACLAASLIGTVIASAGAGSRPLYTNGKVYLAGPYRGAPLSLEVVIPAVSGPYDLGTIAVRAALYVNRATTQVTTISDPLPQIFQGIPLRTRSIRVMLDRPNFTLNPTNCDPFSIDATLFGDEDAVASLTRQFQVANCASLAYAPKFGLRLTGGVRRLGHPAVHATLRAQPGESNTRYVSVTLPKGELLDNAHIGTVCTRGDYAKHACPSGSLIGQAQVTTPLLDKPLAGQVYLRSSEHELPDIAIDLRGQFDIEAVGRIDSVNGGLRARFETVPDAPIGVFTLDLLGGKKGLLQNSESLCGVHRTATLKMIGQNGVQVRRKTKLGVDCSTARRQSRHAARSTRRAHRYAWGRQGRERQ